ncbi:MAG: hemin uptake protein HemP [Betaproteobacteria bacterium]
MNRGSQREPAAPAAFEIATTTRAADPAGETKGGDGALPAIPSASILQGRDAVNIEHNGRIYQLRKTRQGKLILTK